MAGLIEKVIALAQDGDLSDRVRHRLNVLTDRNSLPCTIRSFHAAGMQSQDCLVEIGLEKSWNSESLAQLEKHVGEKNDELKRKNIPFSFVHSGTSTLGRFCYELCRALCPETVVETGVAYGVTSAYILQALFDNDRGRLSSIDLPPLAQRSHDFVGYFVPDALRTRWNLRLGSARKLLAKVLNEGRPIDIFIHDSLHTYSHMKWEFALALDALRPGGVIIADDIEGNRAFEEAVRHPSIESWFAIAQDGKTSICGVMRKRQ